MADRLVEDEEPPESAVLPRCGNERTAMCSWPLAYGLRVCAECDKVASWETELLSGSVMPPGPIWRGGNDLPGDVPVTLTDEARWRGCNMALASSETGREDSCDVGFVEERVFASMSQLEPDVRAFDELVAEGRRDGTMPGVLAYDSERDAWCVRNTSERDVTRRRREEGPGVGRIAVIGVSGNAFRRDCISACENL